MQCCRILNVVSCVNLQCAGQRMLALRFCTLAALPSLMILLRRMCFPCGQTCVLC